MNKEENKKKEIKIGFQNETIESCLEIENIVELLGDKDKRDNIEKCLKTNPKIFTH